MKADLIVKNARIYTVNEKQPWAEALAVKDGKFVYVGSDEGADEYEGEVIDAAGRFILPALIDAHTHIALSSASADERINGIIEGESKTEILEKIDNFIKDHSDMDEYYFLMCADCLNGERLTRDELDAAVPDKKLLIKEAEFHSIWVNTLKLKELDIDEYAEDIAPGLSYFERDEDGRVNGRIYEFCQLPNTPRNVTAYMYEAGLERLLKYWKDSGIVAIFDAGIPDRGPAEEMFFKYISDRDKAGDLPIYIEGCKFLFDPAQLDTAIEDINRYNETYSTEHFKARTMKMMMDGTLIGKTAAIYEPYAGSDTNGGTLVDANTLYPFLLDLNKNGTDFHVHTVGERAIGTVLDAVEMARNEIGDDFRIQVTCAHIETIPDDMVPRFAELGVIANFTPHWFGGNCLGSLDVMEQFIGYKRAHSMYRANSVWNTEATVVFASDTVFIDREFKSWSPYMGFEVGMTRQDNTFIASMSDDFSDCPVYPENSEKVSLSQMIKGYTINAAIQMRLDDKLGSIETGKDGSFLIFENNLFDVDVYDMHKQLPEDVFFNGVKVN